MSMREAIALSAIPIHQELARRVGLERYREWLARLDFGNPQTGTVVATFWLDGPLEISAVEEARFVARLAQQKLDASIRSQSIARDIIRLESRNGIVLYGKTGWRFSSKPNLGWWTGWVEGNGKIAAFALNIDMPAASDSQLPSARRCSQSSVFSDPADAFNERPFARENRLDGALLGRFFAMADCGQDTELAFNADRRAGDRRLASPRSAHRSRAGC